MKLEDFNYVNSQVLCRYLVWFCSGTMRGQGLLSATRQLSIKLVLYADCWYFARVGSIDADEHDTRVVLYKAIERAPVLRYDGRTRVQVQVQLIEEGRWDGSALQDPRPLILSSTHPLLHSSHSA
jgi:hypothetical protein